MRKTQFAYNQGDTGIAGSSITDLYQAGEHTGDEPGFIDMSNPAEVRKFAARFQKSPKGLAFAESRRRPSKTKIRNDLLARLVDYPGRLSILTMPCIYWHLELDLLAAREPKSGRRVLRGDRKSTLTKIYAIEWSKPIYRAALARLPGAGYGLRAKTPWSLSTGVVSDFSLAAFEDYALPDTLDAAWIDLCGQLTERRLDRLEDLRAKVSVLAVTWMNARGNIRGFSSQLEALVAKLGSPDVQVGYSDGTAPMMHAVYDDFNSDQALNDDLEGFFSRVRKAA